jgi:hypothetical protein
MGYASDSNSLCCSNVHPRHLHEVPPVSTECVVDDRVLAGISECPMGEEAEGRTMDGIEAERWCLSIKTPGGRQRETTSLLFPSYMKNDANVTDMACVKLEMKRSFTELNTLQIFIKELSKT